jgi:protein ImuB
MPLAEARMLLEGRRAGRQIAPRFYSLDPSVDHEALRQVAWTLLEWTPLVGLEQVERPDSLLLDVSGCAHLFGGEDGLLEQFRSHPALQGYQFRTAIADTVGAAWAGAHFGRESTILLPEGHQRRFLDALPPAALRLPPGILSHLSELGIDTIGRLAGLPRRDLPSRFGPGIVRRIDQAFGDLPEPVAPERPPEPIVASWSSESPCENRCGLEQIARQLLDTVLDRLQETRRGTRLIAIRLQHEAGRETSLDIRLVSATASRKRLEAVFRTTWERAAIPEAVSGVLLQAMDPIVLPTRKGRLFDDGRDGPSGEWESLLERLSGRLGEGAVVRMERAADHAPERAFRCVPVTRLASRERPDASTDWPSRRPRPLVLLSPPRPIRVVCMAHGPPSHVRCQQSASGIARTWGPERIETGWWREDPIRRDYYRVETEDGRRLWVYRELRTGRWFLHGTFE